MRPHHRMMIIVSVANDEVTRPLREKVLHLQMIVHDGLSNLFESRRIQRLFFPILLPAMKRDCITYSARSCNVRQKEQHHTQDMPKTQICLIKYDFRNRLESYYRR